MAAFCVTCGIEVKEQHIFCGKCGAKIPKMDGNSTNDTAEKPESKMTLTEYRNERENVRKTFFESKTKQTKKTVDHLHQSRRKSQKKRL